MKNPILNGTMIALTAASLFAAACSKPADSKSTTEKTSKVHCQGINECKGHGGCKSEANACAGQNGCKGTSFAETETADDCKAKGGTVAKM